MKINYPYTRHDLLSAWNSSLLCVITEFWSHLETFGGGTFNKIQCPFYCTMWAFAETSSRLITKTSLCPKEQVRIWKSLWGGAEMSRHWQETVINQNGHLSNGNLHIHDYFCNMFDQLKYFYPCSECAGLGELYERSQWSCSFKDHIWIKVTLLIETEMSNQHHGWHHGWQTDRRTDSPFT